MTKKCGPEYGGLLWHHISTADRRSIYKHLCRVTEYDSSTTYKHTVTEHRWSCGLHQTVAPIYLDITTKSQCFLPWPM